jgi:hypothetical protein
MVWFPSFRLLPKARSTRSQRPATCRPTLEALENRLVPATTTLYNNLVDGVALDPSDNLYVAGNITDTADLRGTASAHQWLQGSDHFLAKYNSSGAVVWAKGFADLFGADGGVMPIATFTDPVSGQTSLYVMRSNYATSTFWVSKLAADGTVLWNVQTGWYGALTVDAAGSAYVVGRFSDTVDFDPQQPGLHVLTADGQDAFLFKVDAAGNFQWVDQLGGAGMQGAFSVSAQGSTVYAAGAFSQTFAPANFTDQGSLSTSDNYLAAYDSNGNFLTAQQFVDTSLSSVAVDSSGTYAVDHGNVLEKLNSNGTVAWSDPIVGTGTNSVGHLTIHNGLLYVAGCFSNTVNFNPSGAPYNLTAAGGQDAVVAQYTETGALGWARQMGSSSPFAVGPTSEGGTSLAVSDNGVYSGGFFAPGQASFGPNITLTNNAPGWDGFATKQDLSGNFQWAFQVEPMLRTVDDGGPGYSEVGSGWRSNTAGGFQGDSRYHIKGSGADKAVWTFSNLPAGTYQVQATWVAGNTNASNAPYTLNGGSAILVNQTVAPSDVISDLNTTAWKIVGTATVGGNGTLTVQLSDAANGRVAADGVRVILQAPASPQLAAAGVAPGGEAAASALTPAELAPIAQEAIALLTATGLTAEQRALLNQVQYSIEDLSSSGALGLTVLNTPRVLLDATADGWGWFVDPTPADNGEFAVATAGQELQAQPGSPAFGRMDLLTVVEHELGHVLGLDDLDPGTQAHDLMTATLGTGTRRLPMLGESGTGSNVLAGAALFPTELWNPISDPIALVSLGSDTPLPSKGGLGLPAASPAAPPLDPVVGDRQDALVDPLAMIFVMTRGSS